MLKKELRIAIEAAIKAGEEIMKVYESDFDHELKEDRSPLTIADKTANDIINSLLIKTNIPIISEENKQIDYDIRKTWTRCWIVDPLDGTKEFIKRNGEFTVNIALVENGIPILGVIYVPVNKIIYFADVNTKTFRKASVTSTELSTSKIADASQVVIAENSDRNKIRIVGSRSHMNQHTIDFINEIESKNKEVEIISKGSSLKFCLVAEGKADIYPRFAPTMEWDTAAAQAICSAAGVFVISHESNSELQYNKESLLNPWFICQRK